MERRSFEQEPIEDKNGYGSGLFILGMPLRTTKTYLEPVRLTDVCKTEIMEPPGVQSYFPHAEVISFTYHAESHLNLFASDKYNDLGIRGLSRSDMARVIRYLR